MNEGNKNISYSEIVVGLVLIILFLILIFIIIPWQVPVGEVEDDALTPATFPIITSLIVILLSILLVMSGFKKKTTQKVQDEHSKFTMSNVFNVRIVVALAAMLIYTFIMGLVGFVTATFCCLLFFTLFFGGRGWISVFVFSMGVTFGVYYLFTQMIKIPLP